MLTIITSPETTPIGLAMAMVEVLPLLLTLFEVALPPRRKMLVQPTRIFGLESINMGGVPVPKRELVLKSQKPATLGAVTLVPPPAYKRSNPLPAPAVLRVKTWWMVQGPVPVTVVAPRITPVPTAVAL